MKTKKRGITVISVLILAAGIVIAVFFPKIKIGAGNLGVPGYTGRDIENVKSVVLLAHSVKVEGQTNSVAGVKEAVRLGADAVAVDLCFKKDGTPVMCDNYSNAENSPLLENLFRALNEKKYLETKVFLNIVQLSDLSKLNRLASDYNLASRLIIIGIDSDHYGLIKGDESIIPFYLDYKLTAEDRKAISDNSFTPPPVLEQYQASGIVLDRSDCNEKSISAFNDYGIPVVVSGITSGSQMCDCLTDNAKTVYVKDISNSRKILEGWIEKMQERFESSVEKSLKELSTK